jgi:hypothetical protein
VSYEGIFMRLLLGGRRFAGSLRDDPSLRYRAQSSVLFLYGYERMAIAIFEKSAFFVTRFRSMQEGKGFDKSFLGFFVCRGFLSWWGRTAMGR